MLLGYLPVQLVPEEMAYLARKAIQEVGAKGPADRGKVMGKLMPKVRGKAEGSTVNDIVTALLEKL
ncbi:MAG: GatB/YqeY domain-containing protein [Chloroflexi bacterium]|nr:GatB/YqeY domain-containing protein [Chloroflexota bacterium]